jgi:hypothetical protein
MKSTFSFRLGLVPVRNLGSQLEWIWGGQLTQAFEKAIMSHGSAKLRELPFFYTSGAVMLRGKLHDIKHLVSMAVALINSADVGDAAKERKLPML